MCFSLACGSADILNRQKKTTKFLNKQTLSKQKPHQTFLPQSLRHQPNANRLVKGSKSSGFWGSREKLSLGEFPFRDTAGGSDYCCWSFRFFLVCAFLAFFLLGVVFSIVWCLLFSSFGRVWSLSFCGCFLGSRLTPRDIAAIGKVVWGKFCYSWGFQRFFASLL